MSTKPATKSTRVRITLSAAFLKHLDRAAKSERISRSELLNDCVYLGAIKHGYIPGLK